MEDRKQYSEEIIKIIKEHKSRSNKDLTKAMDFISEDFEFTKKTLLKLSEHLDKLELSYNTLLKEYKSRNGQS